MQETGFNPWVGIIPWRRKWQPTPVFLLKQSHGQRSLVGYSPWGCKESDTTEWLTLSQHFLLYSFFMTHSEFIFMLLVIWCQSSFFHMAIHLFQHHLFNRPLYFSIKLLEVCQKSVNHVYVKPFKTWYSRSWYRKCI